MSALLPARERCRSRECDLPRAAAPRAVVVVAVALAITMLPPLVALAQRIAGD